MLEIPGWAESQRLPNAVAVISALKNTARQARLQEIVFAAEPRHGVINFEGDAHAEQCRKRDDVCVIKRKAAERADFEGHRSCRQERNQSQ